MRYYLPILIFILACCAESRAQYNLVKNPSFEELDGKPKKVGELYKALYWISPTQGTADIFSKVTKAEEIGMPNNTLGRQIARTGDNYAGAIFFGKKTNSTREYIQTELREPLKKDQVYCVEFYVSLSDLSKYGIDKIGAFLSENSVKFDNWEPILVKPQVFNREKKPVNDQYEWRIVCGEYTAKGGEKFITIGNFFLNENTTIAKMRKPRDVPGTQNDYGYYYIDDVAVFSSDSLGGKCDCQEKLAKENPEQVMNFVYSKVEGEEEETLSPEEVIESKSIYFHNCKLEVLPKSKTDLEMIAKLLNENPAVKLEIIGYADSDELKTDAAIAEKRAQAIQKYFTSGAINPERLVIVKGNPISVKESTNEALKSQNRRIDFSIVAE